MKTQEKRSGFRMNNQSFKQPVMEVDIAELVWKILEQWKAILLMAIVMSCAVCGSEHIKDMKVYNAEVSKKAEAEAQKNIPADERINSLLNSLSFEDMNDANMVIREKEWLSKQREYLNKSIFMDTDPYNQVVMTLVYKIDTEDNDEAPALINSFNMYINSDDFAELIKPTIDQSAETKYIGELINRDHLDRIDNEIMNRKDASVGNGNSFIVSIILVDDSNTEETASAAKTALEKYSAQLSSSHPHTLSIVGQDVSYIYNYFGAERQRHILDTIDGMKTDSDRAESELKAEQKLVVKEAMSILNESEKAKSPEPTDTEEELVAPGWSRKSALLGFILGGFLYVGIFTVILILKECVTSARAAERYSGTRLLGEVYHKDISTGLAKLLHSKAIESIRYKRKGSPTAQIKKTAESITAICKHMGINKYSLINSNRNDRFCNDIMAFIADETAKMGIKADIINIEGDFEEEKLLGVENAVLVISHCTKVPMLGKINTLCNAFSINKLGCVYATA